MNSEINRAATMNPAQIPWLNPSRLAQIGYFQINTTHSNTVLQCQFCSMQLTTWTSADSELEMHLRNSPWCPILNNKAIDNIPIDPQALQDALLPPTPQTLPIEISTPVLTPIEYASIYHNYNHWTMRKNSFPIGIRIIGQTKIAS